jgi:hypothetical protein
VNGAVSTRPSTFVWMNSRQVPATGSSTPISRSPGVLDVPVTWAPPSVLVQPWAPGAQTCVWK